MKIRATSKPYGAWATKWRARLALPALLLVCAAVLWGLKAGLGVLWDTVFDSKAASWFQNRFFTDMGNATFLNGAKWRVYNLNWATFRDTVFRLGGIATLLWAGSLVAAVAISRRTAARRTARELEGLLRAFFSQEDVPEFPRAYEDLGNYAAALKDKFRHSEAMVLAEAQRKNDLIAYLAHDLKTPLTSVIGYLSLLAEAPDMPPEQRAKFTGIALEKALRLESLINEFFDITRYNLHEIVLERENFDLGYLLMQLGEEFYPALQVQGKRLALECPRELPISGDPDKLARVFNNILKNALAYSYENTQITLTAEKEEKNIRVEVSNFGKTIPKEKLAMIFDKFYRLDDARSTSSGGAGLGLAIAREIVTAHGGTIGVRSENQVTSFTVILPSEQD